MYSAAPVPRIALVLFQEEQVSAALVQKKILILVANLSDLSAVKEVKPSELNDGDRLAARSLQVALHLHVRATADRLNARVRSILDPDTVRLIARQPSDYYYGGVLHKFTERV